MFAVTEHKLDINNLDDEVRINGNKVACRDRNRNGGGVLIYVNMSKINGLYPTHKSKTILKCYLLI